MGHTHPRGQRDHERKPVHTLANRQTWACAIAVWRIGRIEEKWAAEIGST